MKINKGHSRDRSARATSKLCTSLLLDTQRIGKPLLFELGGKNGVKYISLAMVSHSAVEASTFQLRCKDILFVACVIVILRRCI